MKRIFTQVRGITVMLVLLLAFGPLMAQKFTKHLPQKSSGSEFFDMQAAFKEWAKGKDLSKTKGWKYYKRKEWFNKTRVNADGQFTDPEIMQEAQARVKQMEQVSTERNTAWSPLGPIGDAGTNDSNRNVGFGRINCVAFDPFDENTLWVGTSNGGIWQSTDNGQSWNPRSEGLPILRISNIAIDPWNPDVMYAATGDFDYLGSDPRASGGSSLYGVGLYKSTNGGQSWHATGLNFGNDSYLASLIRKTIIYPWDTDIILVAGAFGIARSWDAGESFELLINNIITDIEIDPFDPDVIYAVSGYRAASQEGTAGIIKSVDFGDNWSWLDSGIPETGVVSRTELTVSAYDSDILYAVIAGLDEGFLAMIRSTDGGDSWVVTADSSEVNLLGWEDGSDKGGQGSYDLTIITDPEDPERVFVGGVNMWGSEDGGLTWDAVSFWLNWFGPSIHADHHDIQYNELNGKYYAAHDGGLDVTDELVVGSWKDAGACFDENENLIPDCYNLPTQWTNISKNIPNTEFYRISVSQSSGEVIGGTQDNGSYYYGNQWISIWGGDGMDCMIDQQNSNILYVTNPNGELTRLDYSGETIDVTSSLTAPIIEAEGQGLWVTPVGMHPTNSDILYAGFRNLFASNDKGANWFYLSDFPALPGTEYVPAIWDFEVNPNNPDNIYVIKEFLPSNGFAGQVWVTFDGGNKWSDISAGLPVDQAFITSVAAGPAENVAIVSVGGFVEGAKLFVTVDGGQSWNNWSVNLPNVPINNVIFQHGSPNNVIYVATDLGVFYTSDLLNDWVPLNQELPNVIVNELEIHYPSETLVAGTYGRGLWATDLVESNVATDIENPLKKATVEVFPNPSNGQFQLKISAFEAQQAHFEIVDVMGRSIHQEELHIVGNELLKQYDLNLSPGYYYLRLHHGKRSEVKKLVVN